MRFDSFCALRAPRLAAWLVSSCVLASSAALAQEPGALDEEQPGAPRDITTSFAIDDSDPEAHVPSHAEAMKKPLEMGYWLMLVSERAEAASARGDHGLAAKYYRALGRAVPDRSVAFRKACDELDRAGDVSGAIASCKAAVSKPGATIEDHVHLVRLLLTPGRTLTPSDVADVDAIVAHVKSELPKQEGAAQHATEDALLVAELSCEVGLRLEDRSRLDECAETIAKLAPDDPRSASFGYASALLAGDLDAAQTWLERGRAAKMPAEALASLQQRLDSERERRHAPRASWLAGLALVIGAALVALRTQRRKRSAQVAA